MRLGGGPAFLWAICAAAAAMTVLAPNASAQQSRTLDDQDTWKTPDLDLTTPAAQLLQARQALARGDSGRSLNLVESWLDRYPVSPMRPEALLVKGDALMAQGDEYSAAFAYEELVRRYPMSEFFVPALEREFQIGVAYAHGLRRKFFGTFRWVDASADAQEILIRIQERLPGSGLAEQAGMELADYYFRTRDMSMAVEAYDVFIQNYPRSKNINKARLRLIASYLASFKGPEYDDRGLVEATGKIKELQVIEPAVSQQIGSEAILVRIYESEAAKLQSQEHWYLKISDKIAAEQTLRRLVKKYPKSIAAIEELRNVGDLLEQLPARYVTTCPNYRSLRKALLGPEYDTALPIGIVADAEAPLPAKPDESRAPVPVPGSGGGP